MGKDLLHNYVGVSKGDGKGLVMGDNNRLGHTWRLIPMVQPERSGVVGSWGESWGLE